MKKLLIASVSVLALSAGAAFAQTTAGNSVSTVTQDGLYGLANVEQLSSSTGANSSSVYQNDKSGNTSPATISDPYGHTLNGGTWVRQDGSQGYANNTSTVNVSSNLDAINVNQDGSAGGYNVSTVNANGSYNLANVYQTSVSGATQTSTVTQNGFNNWANVRQR